MLVRRNRQTNNVAKAFRLASRTSYGMEISQDNGLILINMKAKIENRNGVDYLSFTPEGMRFPTQIPVITKGSRDEANAWTWNGSLETPTVRPSVKTQYANEKGEMVMIHYWLNDGICQCLSDCTDGNVGKNITLIEVVS